MARPRPIEPGPGQRSVWDFPRPPAVERETRPLRVFFAGETIAASERGVKVLETSHPPTFYLPPEDVRTDLLVERDEIGSVCEWKGRATYLDVRVGDRVAERAAFCYREPTRRFREHAGWISFYAGPMDACYVGDESAEPQPGHFYSGWITSDVVGPFKGEEGSRGW